MQQERQVLKIMSGQGFLPDFHDPDSEAQKKKPEGRQ